LTITLFQAYGQRFLSGLKKRVFQQPARRFTGNLPFYPPDILVHRHPKAG
jgi:hypothetical protein